VCGDRNRCVDAYCSELIPESYVACFRVSKGIIYAVAMRVEERDDFGKGVKEMLIGLRDGSRYTDVVGVLINNCVFVCVSSDRSMTEDLGIPRYLFARSSGGGCS
jgi:hypothetical protein